MHGHDDREVVVFGAEPRAVAARVGVDALVQAPVDRDAGHQRVVEVDLGPLAAQQPDDLDRGRLAAVGDAGLVGDPDDEHARAAERAPLVGEHLPCAGDDLRAGARRACACASSTTLAGRPRSRSGWSQVVGVHADAVPADAGRGVVGHEAVRLGGGRLGDLDRVEPVRAAGFGDLERRARC